MRHESSGEFRRRVMEYVGIGPSNRVIYPIWYYALLIVSVLIVVVASRSFL